MCSTRTNTTRCLHGEQRERRAFEMVNCHSVFGCFERYVTLSPVKQIFMVVETFVLSTHCAGRFAVRNTRAVCIQRMEKKWVEKKGRQEAKVELRNKRTLSTAQGKINSEELSNQLTVCR